MKHKYILKIVYIVSVVSLISMGQTLSVQAEKVAIPEPVVSVQPEATKVVVTSSSLGHVLGISQGCEVFGTQTNYLAQDQPLVDLNQPASCFALGVGVVVAQSSVTVQNHISTQSVFVRVSSPVQFSADVIDFVQPDRAVLFTSSGYTGKENFAFFHVNQQPASDTLVFYSYLTNKDLSELMVFRC